MQAEYRLQQEIELERLDVLDLGGAAFPYRDSQTRRSDTSCSVSTGLVM